MENNLKIEEELEELEVNLENMVDQLTQVETQLNIKKSQFVSDNTFVCKK